MLWNEFIEGTGCRDNEYNYTVYKRLELMYMADDSISKAEIYEYGKKLVDNSKSQRQIEFEEDIKARIAGCKSQIESWKKDLEFQEYLLQFDSTPGEKKARRYSIRYTKEAIKKERQRIRELRWVLA